MNDDEMIGYYANLINSLGGQVPTYYLDGIAVYNEGKIYTFMDERERRKLSSFYMTNKPSYARQISWPLNSLSINKDTGTYFSEACNNKYDSQNEQIIISDYRKRLVTFLVESLKLDK